MCIGGSEHPDRVGTGPGVGTGMGRRLLLCRHGDGRAPALPPFRRSGVVMHELERHTGGEGGEGDGEDGSSGGGSDRDGKGVGGGGGRPRPNTVAAGRVYSPPPFPPRRLLMRQARSVVAFHQRVGDVRRG